MDVRELPKCLRQMRHSQIGVQPTQTPIQRPPQNTGGTQSNCNSPMCFNENQCCPFWAFEGECRTNPGFMLCQCRVSCQQCQPNYRYGVAQTAPTTTPIAINGHGPASARRDGWWRTVADRQRPPSTLRSSIRSYGILNCDGDNFKFPFLTARNFGCVPALARCRGPSHGALRIRSDDSASPAILTYRSRPSGRLYVELLIFYQLLTYSREQHPFHEEKKGKLYA
ncbi:shTK domain protein [Ancylostoma duodenale]|uniref:ShTK domain protein n=1 Tax=Ancylostoma duodenale TaxID=51022 RepID=A0A0C2FX39_9BILA|nr:shTK domain protein [Ancylostoma duodenale]